MLALFGPVLRAPLLKIRVLCVDDGEDIPEMLGRCIAAEPDMECAGCLRAADDLLAEVRRTHADIVLLDMSMPGKDPLAAIRELGAAHPGGAGGSDHARGRARVIAYSGRSDRRTVDLALDAGAWGYLTKDAPIPDVLRAIREVALGNVAVGV